MVWFEPVAVVVTYFICALFVIAIILMAIAYFRRKFAKRENAEYECLGISCPDIQESPCLEAADRWGACLLALPGLIRSGRVDASTNKNDWTEIVAAEIFYHVENDNVCYLKKDDVIVVCTREVDEDATSEKPKFFMGNTTT